MVSSLVSLLISSAESKCSMLFGTEKYSGRAMNAGFFSAALCTAVEAASRLAFSEVRTFMWTRLIRKSDGFGLLCCVTGIIPLI